MAWLCFNFGALAKDMARSTRSPQRAPTAPVTPERAGRLCRLLRLLARKPQTRNGLSKSLKIGVRGFYRDLEALRLANIDVLYQDGRYILVNKLEKAVGRLPFPDPGLTLGEAMQLARGRSNAHRKLKKQVEQITKG
jgi:predicted DNA-binding transcriptional regulator YafY